MFCELNSRRLVVEICDAGRVFQQIDAFFRALRQLIVEIRAVFGIKVLVKRHIVIAGNDNLGLEVGLFQPLDRLGQLATCGQQKDFDCKICLLILK